MDTSKLKKFAQYARRYLVEQITIKMKQVLSVDSPARRENPQAVGELEQQIQHTTREQVIDKVAYTWFNRFCALRFMDVNRYSRIGVISPAIGQFQPEILAEAKQGHIDEDIIPRKKSRDQVFDLLSGTIPSPNPQAEAYRLLIVAVCNYWHGKMPYLFEKIADYTELLMPDDLLSGNSILAYTREAMIPDHCKDVEVIGWLYQFYIADKKDEVFEGLKKNKKITPENIPAATQLFTPHWIVRYLVENSLGRLWLLNRPKSQLIDKMDYYIKSQQPETDFLRITSPEEIKVCDPACGSGHMLVYAFDLLYAIYEEEEYPLADIPGMILKNNLYGIEIDERAGALAAFALTMKALGKDKNRRFFRNPVQPNICVLENIHFEPSEIQSYMDEIGHDLFTADFEKTLRQFEEANNFGTLIRPAMANVADVVELLTEKDVSSHLFLEQIHQRVLKIIKQADYLSSKYHVVVANPPYLGGKGMNKQLKTFLQDYYTAIKTDLFAAFIVRNTELALPKGQLGYMTPFVWMFISSYEKLREFLVDCKTITSLIQLEYSGFEGATVPICTFTVENIYKPSFKGGYIKLSDFRGVDNQEAKSLEAIQNQNCRWFYRALANEFKKIPGSPIAYWLKESIINRFSSENQLGNLIPIRGGMTTANNDKFVRLWYEISCSKNFLDNKVRNIKWFPYNKGGEYRKWYGNRFWVVNWENEGSDIKSTGRATVRSEELFLKDMIGWTDVTSFSQLGVRYYGPGFLFDASGPGVFPNENANVYLVLGYLGSSITSMILQALNPTLHIQAGNISSLPWIYLNSTTSLKLEDYISSLIKYSKEDWDSYEASWDFDECVLLKYGYQNVKLQLNYSAYRIKCQERILEMQHLEQENNRIFIEAYGLQDELKPDVPLNEITLTCNPHYRYGNNKSEAELEKLLLADTMKEFISYAVGCMFGRYSLDKPGLILANQGEGIEDYVQIVSEPTFKPIANNVIPILDGDWFADDITEQFRKFLRVTFGETHFEENLKFLEQAIGKDIRKYFLKDFYADHVKRYKKRPIYWLFSSPKGNFAALIYIHRYRPDTISIMLNDYLREYRTKLSVQRTQLEQLSISISASASEKTKALKEIEKYRKIITELADYEREVLYPLAAEKVEIDLDDGVKVNYTKFGAALKKIPGLDTVEE